jgi:sRNA-binding carbon storage regulator CsrA
MGCMLVLSCKKCEAILIDGVIRIEVVNMAKATVRVRLMSPRSLQLPHGIAREETRDRQDSPARISPVGMEVFHLTLINQQIVHLGESVSLGVVDADKSRVLFFVDAPAGTSVMAVGQAGQDRANASSNQILLQFMGQGTERPDEHREKPAPGVASREGQTASVGSGPDVLPFPSNQPHRNRP